MSDNNETSVLGGILKRAYSSVFYENWPIWLGGILIGIMSVITFAWARPWGVVGGLRNWADWFFNYIGNIQPGSLFTYYFYRLHTDPRSVLGSFWLCPHVQAVCHSQRPGP